MSSTASANSSSSVVVFDLGKVLVDFDYSIVGRKVAARGRLSPVEVQKILDHSPLLFRLETGSLTNAEFFEEVRSMTGFQGDLEEFGSLFADIFTPIPEMVKLHETLKRRGVPTFIFSNTNDFAASHIRRSFPFFSKFDDYVLSYEHGAMKPDAALYEVVEQKTGRRGQAIVYLDDRAENIAAGVARGWRGILHADPAQSRAVLESFGLLD